MIISKEIVIALLFVALIMSGTGLSSAGEPGGGGGTKGGPADRGGRK